MGKQSERLSPILKPHKCSPLTLTLDLKYTLNEPCNPKAYPEYHKRTLDNRLQRIRTGPANPAGKGGPRFREHARHEISRTRLQRGGLSCACTCFDVPQINSS
jgi:hypothetical protein